jgi:hypothetical protein
VKTMAIRVEDELHAQFVILAQLDGVPLTEELRLALEAHVAGRRSQSGFAEKAQAVLAEIDRDAKARREAIQALFAEKGATGPEPSGEESPRRANAPKGRAK